MLVIDNFSTYFYMPLFQKQLRQINFTMFWKSDFLFGLTVPFMKSLKICF